MKKFNLRKKIILFLSIPLICSVFLCSFIGLKNSKMNQANAIIEYVDSSIYINELASQTTQLENSYSLDSYYPILPENQTNSNLCWIYSSLKVLETSLMRQKNEYHNFSEIATALLYYENYTLTDSNIQNEFKKIDKEGHFSNFNQVAQNQGLVYENVLSNDVYYDVNEENYENYDFYLDHIDNKIMDNIKPINIYEDETFLKAKPDKKVEILKRYILNYGGFFAGLERGIISSATNVYVNTNEPSHSANDGAIPTSHAVCIIGWNDEKDCGENGKGAFYAINSWGVSSTSFSCFWIPYSYQHIYNDTYGYICVDKVNKDITLLSSTAGETDGFSSKFMNSYSQNPTNLFLYKEEL